MNDSDKHKDEMTDYWFPDEDKELFNHEWWLYVVLMILFYAVIGYYGMKGILYVFGLGAH